MIYLTKLFRLCTKLFSTKDFGKPLLIFLAILPCTFYWVLGIRVNASTPYLYIPISYPLPSQFLPHYFTVLFCLYSLYLFALYYTALSCLYILYSFALLYILYPVCFIYCLLFLYHFRLYLFYFYHLSSYFTAYKLFKKNIPLFDCRIYPLP